MRMTRCFHTESGVSVTISLVILCLKKSKHIIPVIFRRLGKIDSALEN